MLIPSVIERRPHKDKSLHQPSIRQLLLCSAAEFDKHKGILPATQYRASIRQYQM